MKKLSILFVSALTLVLTSCSSDDNNDTPNQVTNDLSAVGKWEYSKISYNNTGQEVLGDYHHQAECGKDYIEYLSNGTFKEMIFNKDLNGKCVPSNRVGQYKKEGATLSLNGVQTGSVTYEVLLLNTTTLKVKRTDKLENVTYTTFIVYKKI